MQKLTHDEIVAGIVAITTFDHAPRPVVRTYDDEAWMDNPAAALNAGRFEADGFIPRNAVPVF